MFTHRLSVTRMRNLPLAFGLLELIEPFLLPVRTVHLIAHAADHRLSRHAVLGCQLVRATLRRQHTVAFLYACAVLACAVAHHHLVVAGKFLFEILHVWTHVARFRKATAQFLQG
jgi:hypothetical protein